MSRRISIFGSSFASGPVWEPETIAYMTAVGIPADATVYYPSTAFERTGLQLWQYVDAFVVAAKGGGWWSKMYALYLYIGGTATAHKFNAVNPLDTDAAFRLTFFGGITHSSEGMKGNGINGYCMTHCTYSAMGTPYSRAMGYYNWKNDWAVDSMDMGSRGSGSLPIFAIAKSNTGTPVVFSDGLDFTAHRIIRTVPATNTGFYDFSIESANLCSLARNGAILGSVNTTPQTQVNGPSVPITLMARNDSGTPVQFSPVTYNMHYIAQGLTIAERLSLYNATQALQVALGRPHP
jgi:hypothetical protein